MVATDVQRIGQLHRAPQPRQVERLGEAGASAQSVARPPALAKDTPSASEGTIPQRLAAAVEWAREYRGLSPMSGMNQIWDADYIKLREVALTYSAPGEFAGNFGMRSLSLSLRARNLGFWVNDDYRGLDPELNNNARCGTGDVDCNFLLGQEAWRIPIPRRLLLAVRAGF